MMYTIHIISILIYYELISFSCIIIKCMKSLTIIVNILKQNILITISLHKNYNIAIIYFKKLAKHLNAKDIINVMKMKLLNNCFNE